MPGFDYRGGKPQNYTLGRGKLYVKGDTGRYSGGVLQSAFIGYRDLGNCTAFTIAQESEVLEHRSFLLGVQTIDLEVPVSTKMTLTFQLDEINAVNLARWLSGELITQSQGSALANAACVDSTTLGGVLAGDFNYFFDSGANDQVTDVWFNLELNITTLGGVFRAINFDSTQTIVVRKQATTRTASDGTVLTEGVHYELDRKMGRIRFFVVTGGLASNDTVQVRWTAPAVDRAAGTAFSPSSGTAIDTSLYMIQPLTKTGINVTVLFVAENPNDGDKQESYEFWSVKLKPDGEYAAIGDEWGQLGFTGAVQSVASYPPGSSQYGRVLGRDSFVP